MYMGASSPGMGHVSMIKVKWSNHGDKVRRRQFSDVPGYQIIRQY